MHRRHGATPNLCSPFLPHTFPFTPRLTSLSPGDTGLYALLHRKIKVPKEFFDNVQQLRYLEWQSFTESHSHMAWRKRCGWDEERWGGRGRFRRERGQRGTSPHPCALLHLRFPPNFPHFPHCSDRSILGLPMTDPRHKLVFPPHPSPTPEP